MALTHVGSSPVRVDGLLKVSGTAPYLPAMSRPGMLHMALVRSRSAHGRLVSIDTSKVKRLPGVVLALSGADLERMPDVDPWIGPAFKDHPLLAIGKVRFMGEAVAAVVAESVEAAREAAELVEVEVEELPAIFDAREAAQPG